MESTQKVTLQSSKPSSKVVASTTASALTGAVTALLIYAFKLPPGVAESITVVVMTASTFAAGYFKKNQLKDVQIVARSGNK